MKIAYITFKFPTFSETFIQREVKQLRESNIDVDVYSIRNAKNKEWNINIDIRTEKITKYYPMGNIETYSKAAQKIFPDFKYMKELLIYLYSASNKSIPFHHLLAYLPSASCIIHEIEQNEYDHIHAHWAGLPTSIAKIASSITKIPYSISAHAHDIYTNSSINLEEKFTNAEFIATCTKYNKKYINKKFKNSTVYCNYHGLLPEEYTYSNSEQSQAQIVAGGRFVNKKGFENLINSLHILKNKKSVQIPCTIFGDGPLYNELKMKKKDLDMDYLKLPGKIPHEQVKELLYDAQIFIAPSVVAEDGDRDGIPNVILEAFACCTPAIGTNISGIPEVVRENETGWLVEENDEQALAETLLQAWCQPSLCTQYGRSGRQLVEKEFDIRENVDELVSIFHEHVT